MRLVHLRKSASLAVLVLLPAVVACGGGDSDAQKAKDAAASAKAACAVFQDFHAPSGTDKQSQINYVKASYGAFLKAADLASAAAQDDPRWKALESAAEREAAAFEVISKATEGVDQSALAGVNKAVAEAKAARPIFIAECAKVDPKRFTESPKPTPKGSSSPVDKGTKGV
jgi:hypothetical protein